jgi:ribosome biogenesis GTPase A
VSLDQSVRLTYSHVQRGLLRRRVMIVGNHSAGKSSFINWYIGENIQKTGVAIETRGFTFVTSGK